MWPITPPDWLLPWVIWRLRYAGIAGSPPVPVGTPKEIPPWAWGFLKWVVWCRNGRIPEKRPISTVKAPIPREIPKWAWQVYKQILIAVPIKPPPDPPPPSGPIPPNSWTLPLPIVYTSWGPSIDWRTSEDMRNAVNRFVDSGIPTVALQIGQFESWHANMLKEAGIKVPLWTPLAADRDEEWLGNHGADGYIPQIEGRDEYENALRQFQRGVGRGLSRSVVSTFSGLETFTRRPDGTTDGESTTVEVENLIAAGCTNVQVECYTGDMLPRNVDSLMFEAKHRGFYYAIPVVGFSHRPYYMDDYRPAIDRFGRRIGAYLAEPMQARHYAEIKAL